MGDMILLERNKRCQWRKKRDFFLFYLVHAIERKEEIILEPLFSVRGRVRYEFHCQNKASVSHG